MSHGFVAIHLTTYRGGRILAKPVKYKRYDEVVNLMSDVMENLKRKDPEEYHHLLTKFKDV